MLPGGATLTGAEPELREEDRAQLERLVAIVHDVLGPELHGACLFGSATLDGLRPTSDLDVLAVVRRPAAHDEKRRLFERLLAISWKEVEGGHWRRVELTVVAEPDVRPWRFPPRMDFQYGDWLRAAFERGDEEPWESGPNPDLAVLFEMALRSDRPLAGPPPAELLQPVPREDLVAGMTGDLDGLLKGLEEDEDTRNVVLTLARILCTLETGSIRSKNAAADWVLPRLPDEHRPVLARARAVYLGEEPERWDDLHDRLRPFSDWMTAEIGRAQPSRSSTSS